MPFVYNDKEYQLTFPDRALFDLFVRYAYKSTVPNGDYKKQSLYAYANMRKYDENLTITFEHTWGARNIANIIGKFCSVADIDLPENFLKAYPSIRPAYKQAILRGDEEAGYAREVNQVKLGAQNSVVADIPNEIMRELQEFAPAKPDLSQLDSSVKKFGSLVPSMPPSSAESPYNVASSCQAFFSLSESSSINKIFTKIINVLLESCCTCLLPLNIAAECVGLIIQNINAYFQEEAPSPYADL